MKQKLLTERQVIFKRAIARYLFGTALLLLGFISMTQAWNTSDFYYYFFETDLYRVEPKLSILIRHFCPIISVWGVGLFFILGLWILRPCVGIKGSYFIKHSLIALFVYVFFQGLLIPVFKYLIMGNMMEASLIKVAIFPIIGKIIPVITILYLLWVFYFALKNTVDERDARNIRLIIAVLLFVAFIICIDAALLTRIQVTVFRHQYGSGNIIHGMGTELSVLQDISVIWYRGLVGLILILLICGLRGIVALSRGHLFEKTQNELQEKRTDVSSFFMGIVLISVFLCSILAYHIVYWRTYRYDIFGSYGNTLNSYFMIGAGVLVVLLLLFYRKLDKLLFGKDVYGFEQVIFSLGIPWLCYFFITNTYFYSSSAAIGYYFYDVMPLFYLLCFMMIVLYTLCESHLRIKNVKKRWVKFAFLSICSSPMLFVFLLPK